MKFKVDDRVIVDHPGHMDHGKKGRVADFGDFGDEICVQLEDGCQFFLPHRLVLDVDQGKQIQTRVIPALNDWLEKNRKYIKHDKR